MTEHKQPVSDEYNANLAAAILRQPSQEASSLPVVAWWHSRREFHEYDNSAKEDTVGYVVDVFVRKEPTFGTVVYSPLVLASDAQSQLTALRAERDEWRDRATEAQAERDASREERDVLKAAPGVDVNRIMVLVDKLLECQVDEDNCAHLGSVAEHDAATADRAAARSALRADLEGRKP